MPEMPEVEVMTERLQKYVGYTIVDVDNRGGTRYLPGVEKKNVSGQTINGVFRRGKFMVFALTRGAILAHNAMSGYWDSDDEAWTFDYVEGKRTSKQSDIRCVFLVEAVNDFEEHHVYFHDARKFGFLRYLNPDELSKRMSKLGPEIAPTKNIYEPTAVIDENSFVKLIMSSNKPVKEILMNQDKIAGIGNIYAAEACWHAKVSPFAVGNTLGVGTSSLLYHSAVFSVTEALRRDLKYDDLKIYRRKTCSKCGGKVSAEKLKGRSTYWCTACQP